MSNRTTLLLLFSFFHYAALVFAYKDLSFKSLAQLTNAIQPDRLSMNGTLMKPLMIKRVSDTPGNSYVRDFIISHFLQLGWDVKIDRSDDTTPLGKKKFTNIIATLDPNSLSHLVLAAHFDSMLAPNFDFIGASDSAVSCGIMMSLAETLTELFKQGKLKTTLPSKSVQMVFFDGEEAFVEWGPTDSIYGAKHLAKTWESSYLPYPISLNYKNQLDQIDVLVLLDLLGTTQTTIPNHFPATNDLFHKIMSIENKLNNLSLLNRNSQKNGEVLGPIFDPFSRATFMGNMMEDDHVPFLQRGVKILYMIPFPFPFVWHTEADTPDHIDQSVVENLDAILLCFIAEYLELEVSIQ